MVVETIQRNRGGFPINNYLLHNGAENSRWRPRISVRATHESMFQYKEKGIHQNRFYIRSSRVHKNLEKKVYQLILMGDINKYSYAKKSGHSPPN